MMRRALITILFLLGCSSEEKSPVDACSAETAAIQKTILTPRCGTAGCHAAAEPANGLDLVSPDLPRRVALVKAQGCLDKVLVRPGDPTGSYLMAKIVDAKPACGARMPLGEPALPSSDVECLRAWIRGLDTPDASVVDAAGDAVSDAVSDAADVTTCPSGQSSCGGTCVDTATSASNCGGCGKACASGQSCAASTCTCGSGLTACGPSCLDTKTSTTNCGACGKACVTGQSCVDGACKCTGTLTSCSGSCVDIGSSPLNCGACGMACASGAVCSLGKCLSSCPTGTTACSGACVDISTSSFNCGGCGKTCAAGQTCVGGACACPSGTTLCGGTCVDTTKDSANCGACGMTCGGGATCSSSVCACSGGKLSCGGTCVATATDVNNCGACGKVCPSGQTCSAGLCTCGAPVSYAARIQDIWNKSCASAGCHAGVKPASSLNLTSGASYGALVNAPSASCGGKIRVVPGAVSSSYLMNKLTGVGMCNGTQMPKTGTSLPAADLDAIRSWICSGAKND